SRSPPTSERAPHSTARSSSSRTLGRAERARLPDTGKGMTSVRVDGKRNLPIHFRIAGRPNLWSDYTKHRSTGAPGTSRVGAHAPAGPRRWPGQIGRAHV